MDADPSVIAAAVAGLISLTGGVLSHRSAVTAIRRELQQTQFANVIAKRIELYPQLWRIHVCYETNWQLECKPKDREWARRYLAELNEFNLTGGVFFSQALYEAFYKLREALHGAIVTTRDGESVPEAQTTNIRLIVYGTPGTDGLSTIEKDDLGSYRPVELQRRPAR
jgi:hypothetical protein